MRLSILILTLAALGLTEHLLADEPPALKIDLKKAKELEKQRRESLLATSLTPYQKVGKKDPRWDATVERALRANVERVYGPEWDKLVEQAKFQQLLGEAVRAGCDDPVVRYMHLKYAKPTDKIADRPAKLQKAVKALGASEYPHVLKAYAWLTLAADLLQKVPAGKLTDAEREEAEGCRAEALRNILAAAREKPARRRDELIELCNVVHQTGRLDGRQKEWFDALEAEVLSKLDKGGPAGPRR